MNYRKSVISGKKLAEVLVHWVREFHQMPSTKYKTQALFFGIQHIRTSGFFWTIFRQMQGSGFAGNLRFLEILP